MGFEPTAEQKLELVVITNLFPVAQKTCIWKVILGFGRGLPIPRDIRDESGLVRFTTNVIFSD